MKKLFTILLFTFPFAMNAQQTKKTKKDCACSFSSINQAGLLEGSGGSSFQIQTINGVRYKSWFAGVGVGIDKYRLRSIPVFLDLRKDILKKDNTPFIYGDIGLNFPWIKKRVESWWRTDNFHHGLYYDAGVGYKLTLKKNRGILFSGGFSVKKLSESGYYPCDFVPCQDRRSDQVYFTLKRFSLKAGLQL